MRNSIKNLLKKGNTRKSKNNLRKNSNTLKSRNNRQQKTAKGRPSINRKIRGGNQNLIHILYVLGNKTQTNHFQAIAMSKIIKNLHMFAKDLPENLEFPHAKSRNTLENNMFIDTIELNNSSSSHSWQKVYLRDINRKIKNGVYDGSAEDISETLLHYTLDKSSDITGVIGAVYSNEVPEADGNMMTEFGNFNNALDLLNNYKPIDLSLKIEKLIYLLHSKEQVCPQNMTDFNSYETTIDPFSRYIIGFKFCSLQELIEENKLTLQQLRSKFELSQLKPYFPLSELMKNHFGWGNGKGTDSDAAIQNIYQQKQMTIRELYSWEELASAGLSLFALKWLYDEWIEHHAPPLEKLNKYYTIEEISSYPFIYTIDQILQKGNIEQIKIAEYKLIDILAANRPVKELSKAYTLEELSRFIVRYNDESRRANYSDETYRYNEPYYRDDSDTDITHRLLREICEFYPPKEIKRYLPYIEIRHLYKYNTVRSLYDAGFDDEYYVTIFKKYYSINDLLEVFPIEKLRSNYSADEIFKSGKVNYEQLKPHLIFTKEHKYENFYKDFKETQENCKKNWKKQTNLDCIYDPVKKIATNPTVRYPK